MEAIVRDQYPRVKHRLASVLTRKLPELWELCIERGMTIGVEQYGDSSFHLPLVELKREVNEELADALWWESIYGAKEEKRI